MPYNRRMSTIPNHSANRASSTARINARLDMRAERTIMKQSQKTIAADVVSDASNTALVTIATVKGAARGVIASAARAELGARMGVKTYAQWAVGSAPASAQEWADFALVAYGRINHAAATDDSGTKRAISKAARTADTKARAALAALIVTAAGDDMPLPLHSGMSLPDMQAWASALPADQGAYETRATRLIAAIGAAAEVTSMLDTWTAQTSAAAVVSDAMA